MRRFTEKTTTLSMIASSMSFDVVRFGKLPFASSAEQFSPLNGSADRLSIKKEVTIM